MKVVRTVRAEIERLAFGDAGTLEYADGVDVQCWNCRQLTLGAVQCGHGFGCFVLGQVVLASRETCLLEA